MQRKRKQHTCMFDWQATQTQPCLFSTLSKGESHFRSLVCIMRNSKYASTSIMCTLRNSKCAFRIKIQNTHFAVVWKQSKSFLSCVHSVIQISQSKFVTAILNLLSCENALRLWCCNDKFFLRNGITCTVHTQTERQKKLITSSEQRSLKSTASKLIIIFRHRQAIVLLMTHIWKIKRLLLPKMRKMWWNYKMSRFKNHRNCSLRTSMKDRQFRTFNSYSVNFKGGLCNRRIGYCLYRAPRPGGEQFLWFLKNDLLWFHLILFFFDSSKHIF